MTASRRSFIGTVIGTFVGSQLPFKLEEAPESKVEKLTAFDLARIFTINDMLLKRFRIELVISDDEVAKGPPIVDIQKDDFSIKFIPQHVKVTSKVKYKGLRLIDDRGIHVRSSNFGQEVWANVGDILKFDYTIHFGG